MTEDEAWEVIRQEFLRSGKTFGKSGFQGGREDVVEARMILGDKLDNPDEIRIHVWEPTSGIDWDSAPTPTTHPDAKGKQWLRPR